MKQSILALLLIANALVSINSCAATSESMVRLIADAESFKGKSVETFGYMSDVGGVSLYLTKDHVGDASSSILLQIQDEMVPEVFDCANQYVRVEGDLVIQESMLFLENIVSIYDPENVRFCYKKD